MVLCNGPLITYLVGILLRYQHESGRQNDTEGCYHSNGKSQRHEKIVLINDQRDKSIIDRINMRAEHFIWMFLQLRARLNGRIETAS